jgi:hypothetical protein
VKIGFPQDAIQNMNYSKTKLTKPVLALGPGEPVACRIGIKIANRKAKFCLMLKERTFDMEWKP